MNPTSNIDAVSRRGFFQLTLGWIAAIFAACASAAGAVRFLVPNVLFEPSLVFKVGKPEDYPDGSVTFLEEERVFLVRKGNTFRCLSAICTHLGCTVNRTSQGYHCPCHGSFFDDQGILQRPENRHAIMVDGWEHVSHGVVYQHNAAPPRLEGPPTGPTSPEPVFSPPPEASEEDALIGMRRHRSRCKYCRQKGHFNFECRMPHRLCHVRAEGKCLVPTRHARYRPHDEQLVRFVIVRLLEIPLQVRDAGRERLQ